MCSWSVATIFLPEASTPEMGTLDAANLAQEGDEALRWDLLASSHLQRRRPFAAAFPASLGKAERIRTSGRSDLGACEFGLASKLAPGSFAPLFLLPSVQRRVGMLQDRVLILPTQARLTRAPESG
jgi:hypothetical protein